MSKQEVDNALKDIADVFEYQRAEIARLTDRLSQHDILIKSIKDERDTLLLQVESLNAQLKASWENKPEWINELHQHARGALGKVCEHRNEIGKEMK